MCTWYLSLHTWNTLNTQMPATMQGIRWRTELTTRGTRCWRCSRCQAGPSPAIQREPAGVGGLQRGCIVLHRGGSAETPKLRCASFAFIKVWKAEERLLQAQRHCANGSTRDGRRYERSCTYRCQGTGKQAIDCNTPSLAASTVQYAVERWQRDKNYGGFVDVWQKPDWVQVHRGREHSFA